MRRTTAHALVQTLSLTIQAIATNRGVNVFAVFLFEVVPIGAEIGVGLEHMHQFPGDEFEDDDIIEVTDDRNVIGKYVLGVGEVHKRGKKPFSLVTRQPPIVVDKHLNHRFERGNALLDEIRQRFVAANFVEDIPNCLDYFGFFGVSDRCAGLFERLAKKLQIAVREFEGKL